MIKCNFALIFLVSILGISSSYLIGEIEGEFRNDLIIWIGIEFSRISDKYLLHAIDSNRNKLSIKTSKSFANDNQIIINFNGQTCTRRAYKYLIFRYMGAFYLDIQLEFKANNLYASIIPKYPELIISNISYRSSSSRAAIENDWPSAGDLSKLTNRIKIWIGYDHDWIGKSHSDWPINQIIGCVHQIDVNGKSVIFDKQGNNFYSDCFNEVTESICEQSWCRNETDYQYILGCRLSRMSTAARCYPDVTDNTEGLHSYQPITDGNVTLKLGWIPQLSISQCLMHIITSNESIIDIYINSANQIILETTIKKSIKSKYNSYQISSVDIHALSIGFIDHNLTIRISNGSFIKTRMLPNQDRIKTVYIGWNPNRCLCQPIRNKFGIQLNSNLKSACDGSRCPKVPQINAKCPNGPQINATQFLNPFLWSSIIINIALVSILLLIIGKRIIDHRRRKEITRRNSNVYEQQQQEFNGINLTSPAIQRLGIGENVDGGHHGTVNVTNSASAPQDETNEYDYVG